MLQNRLSEAKVVGISHQHTYIHWLITLALSRLSRCTVSLSAEPGQIQPSHGANLVINGVDNAAFDGAQMITLSEAEWREVLNTGDPTPVVNSGHQSDPARIALSSGSTGEPKRVLLTQGTLVSRMKSGIFGSAMRADPRVLCQLPRGTFGGFGVPIRTWYYGGAVLLDKLSIKTLSRETELTVVTTPADLHEMLAQLPREHRPFDNLTIIVGGAPLPIEVARQVWERLTKNLLLTYGSTETTTVATVNAAHKFTDPELTGLVLPWITLEIVDDQGHTVEHGIAGDVRIRCEGYGFVLSRR